MHSTSKRNWRIQPRAVIIGPRRRVKGEAWTEANEAIPKLVRLVDSLGIEDLRQLQPRPFVNLYISSNSTSLFCRSTRLLKLP